MQLVDGGFITISFKKGLICMTLVLSRLVDLDVGLRCGLNINSIQPLDAVGLGRDDRRSRVIAGCLRYTRATLKTY